MSDLKNPRIIILKGFLFLGLGIFAAGLLLLYAPSLTVAALLALVYKKPIPKHVLSKGKNRFGVPYIDKKFQPQVGTPDIFYVDNGCVGGIDGVFFPQDIPNHYHSENPNLDNGGSAPAAGKR